MTKSFKTGVTIASLALLGLIIYSTLQLSEHKVEVCMTFEGRSHCATAAAPTLEEAVRTAQSVACANITRGRDDNMVCLGRAPGSVRKLEE